MKYRIYSKIIVSFLFLVFIFTACRKDENFMPPYTLEIATVTTNSAGRITTVIPDDGEPMQVTNNYILAKPDASLRVKLLIVKEANQKVNVKQCVPIYTVFPQVKSVPVLNSPFQIVAVWCSGGYLNFSLNLPDAPGKHTKYLGVYYLGEKKDAHQHKTLTYEVYYQNDILQSFYTTPLNMSCNIYTALKNLQYGDSIAVVQRTNKGNIIYTLPYHFSKK